MFIRFCLIWFLFSVIILSNQNPTGMISGKVLDSETLSPLIGVNIVIKSSLQGTSTDREGKFEFNNLNSGTYSLEFSYVGYEKIVKPDVIVRPGRSTVLNIMMTLSILEIEGVVVKSGYFSEISSKPAGTTNFSSEEIRRAPGSAGDVSRIIFGLPSLAKVNDQRNSLIVRGGSPIENSFYLDNIEIPNINHFPVQGSSDGPIGLINVDFIENVNFYSGGFNAEYGDKMSSIMEIRFREGSKDKFNPQLNLNMAGLGGQIEGPIGSVGNYLFSASKSYLDLILNEDETGGAMPNYGDAQGKIVFNLDKKNKLSFLELFSFDEINLSYENALNTDLTNIYGTTNGISNVFGVNWENIWGNSGFSNTSLSLSSQTYNRDYFETKSTNHLFTNKSRENILKLRNINYLKINEGSSLEFGIETGLIRNSFDLLYEKWMDNYGNITPELKIETKMNSMKSALFAVHHWKLMEKFKVSAGGRVEYFDFNKRLNISPRLSVLYFLDPITTLSANSGIYYQYLPNHILIQKKNFVSLKTPALNFYSFGISRQIGESTRLSIETFYKSYKNLPLDPSQPNSFLFDQAVTEGLFLNHENLTDNGKAFSRGIEVMLQKKLADELYGMVSFGISKSRYKDFTGQWRDRIYDNRFNFTLDGGYIPNDEWEFKFRWIYAGGVPYTPFDLNKSTEFNKGIWKGDLTNSERLPDYHSLNLRIDKRFYFTNTNLILYLSVWNIYGRENIAQYVWNEIKNEPDKMKQWSMLPVIGVEYEF